jgi:hypothetical protein
MRTTILLHRRCGAGDERFSTTACAARVWRPDNDPHAIPPQLVIMSCPNQSLQVICSLASGPAQGACWWLGWNHGAEVGCVQGITLAHMPWCTPCSFT